MGRGIPTISQTAPKAMGEKFSIGHIGGIQAPGIVKGMGVL